MLQWSKVVGGESRLGGGGLDPGYWSGIRRVGVVECGRGEAWRGSNGGWGWGKYEETDGEDPNRAVCRLIFDLGPDESGRPDQSVGRVRVNCPAEVSSSTVRVQDGEKLSQKAPGRV